MQKAGRFGRTSLSYTSAARYVGAQTGFGHREGSGMCLSMCLLFLFPTGCLFFFFFHQGVSLFFLFFFLLFLFSLPLLLLQLQSVDCSAAHGPPPLPFHNFMMKNIYVAQEKKIYQYSFMFVYRSAEMLAGRESKFRLIGSDVGMNKNQCV